MKQVPVNIYGICIGYSSGYDEFDSILVFTDFVPSSDFINAFPDCMQKEDIWNSVSINHITGEFEFFINENSITPEVTLKNVFILNNREQ